MSHHKEYTCEIEKKSITCHSKIRVNVKFFCRQADRHTDRVTTVSPRSIDAGAYKKVDLSHLQEVTTQSSLTANSRKFLQSVILRMSNNHYNFISIQKRCLFEKTVMPPQLPH